MTVHPLIILLLPALIAAAEAPWPGFGEREQVVADACDDAAAWRGGRIVADAGHAGPGLRLDAGQQAVRSLPAAALRGARVALDALVSAERATRITLTLETRSGGGDWRESRLWVPPNGRQPERTFPWRRAEGMAYVPADCTEARVRLRVQAEAGGWAALDEVAVTVVERAPGATTAAGTPAAADPLGRLRGCMVGRSADAQTFDALFGGFRANLARVQIGAWALHHQYPLLRDDYEELLAADLAAVEGALAAAASHGARVVIDLHTLSEGFWATPAARARLIEVWRRIAERWRGHPALAGYDLANEPFDFAVWGLVLDAQGRSLPPPRADNAGRVAEPPAVPIAWPAWEPGRLTWNETAELVARAIRAVDARTPIIYEPGPGGSGDGFATCHPLTVPGVVYSFHMYLPQDYTHQGVADRRGIAPSAYPGEIAGRGWDAAALRAAMAGPRAFQERWGARMYVGEFSAVRWAPGAATYLADLIAIVEDWGWDWSYHAFREAPMWDVEIPADAPRDLLEDQRAAARSDPHTDRAEVIRAWFARNRFAEPRTP